MDMEKTTTRHRAIEWMNRNWKVVKMFEDFAKQFVDRNRRFGINLLRERVRWECIYEYGEDDFKFPNEYSPYVARYLLGSHPEWSTLMTCHLTQDENCEVRPITAHEVLHSC